MTSQKVTFSKQHACEFYITKLVDNVPLTEEELAAIKAAGVNMELVENYVKLALGSTEDEGEAD